MKAILKKSISKIILIILIISLGGIYIYQDISNKNKIDKGAKYSLDSISKDYIKKIQNENPLTTQEFLYKKYFKEFKEHSNSSNLNISDCKIYINNEEHIITVVTKVKYKDLVIIPKEYTSVRMITWDIQTKLKK